LNKYSFDELDNMSVEELERIVDDDARKPIDEQMDDGTLLYILELLENSGEYENLPDVKSAHTSFLNVYLEKEKKQKPVRHRSGAWKKPLLHVACVILAMLFCFGMGNYTASAAYSHEYSNVLWNDTALILKGVDGYAAANYILGDYSTLPELEYAYSHIKLCIASSTDIMINYVPEGYEYLKYWEAHAFYGLGAILKYSNGENTINLEYYSTYGDGKTYFKDEGDPEEYVVREITHYIMTYNGEWKAIWKNGSVECCISGVESREELIKMIDSIYIRTEPQLTEEDLWLN